MVNEANFQCDVCKKIFNLKEGMEQHKHDVHAEKQGNKFTQKSFKFSKTWIIAIIVLVAIVGAVFALTSFSVPSNSVTQTQTTLRAEGYTGQLIAGSTTPYLRYNEADFQKAKSEGKAVYLYFYATWCVICAAERPSIFAAFNELNVSNAIGFEAHWSDGQNTAADDNLARQYGVGTQHTHIFLDRNGNVIYRTLAGVPKDVIKSEIIQAAQV